MTDLQELLQESLGTAYTIERELGGGATGRVFVAKERALGRRVALKALLPELAGDVSTERFAREIRVVTGLHDPRIVPVLSAGVAAGLPYYTMPLVDGESLRARLDRGEVPPDEAMRILRDVAAALQAAHARGIVHRDIKPENVLLAGRTAVVTDFGIARALARSRTEEEPGDPITTLTHTGMSLGTPAYMAPEQAACDEVDERADLYAWGMVAYELLAGAHPFSSRTTAPALIAAQMTEAPVPLCMRSPGVPAALGALIDRCLAKRPDERPGSAAEVLAVLDEAASHSADGAPASTPSEGTRVRRGDALHESGPP